ncbi:ATP-binding SpoIIE family protein phosphatase [Uliginosibacterium sp. H1]|uniref:ATP-binding SpoIIE family protein phosphatase n=1 Tax=Uliginosibacterium sp. H1 TaxID=3114757 RepID=UPI002E19CCE3|nr:ATP-binding SpoIIE family protein phosphatase [Uliginosibacterium sp. H1]
MDAKTAEIIAIREHTHVAEARRRVIALTRRHGVDEVREAQISVVTSEIASNVFKHGGGGTLFLMQINDGERNGIEIVASDKGPGMHNVSQCLADGYSTAGSLGLGLGAIVRQSDAWDIFSLPGRGTVSQARFWFDAQAAPATTVPVMRKPNLLEITGISSPKVGQDVSGDCWRVRRAGQVSWIMVADGLGHGPMAAPTAERAIEIFESSPLDSPADILARLHEGLRQTRGAVAAVAAVDAQAGGLRYASIGNISGVRLDEAGTQHLVVQDGTLGYQARPAREQSYPWTPTSMLIMSSDGLSSRWSQRDYPGLLMRAGSLAAATLFRDLRRDNDDATIVVARNGRPS